MNKAIQIVILPTM